MDRITVQVIVRDRFCIVRGERLYLGEAEMTIRPRACWRVHSEVLNFLKSPCLLT